MNHRVPLLVNLRDFFDLVCNLFVLRDLDLLFSERVLLDDLIEPAHAVGLLLRLSLVLLLLLLRLVFGDLLLGEIELLFFCFQSFLEDETRLFELGKHQLAGLGESHKLLLVEGVVQRGKHASQLFLLELHLKCALTDLLLNQSGLMIDPRLESFELFDDALDSGGLLLVQLQQFTVDDGDDGRLRINHILWIDVPFTFLTKIDRRLASILG